jgi:hypothetical protein
MSPRDRAPYLEATTNNTAAVPLHAMHNLTSSQVDIILRALKNHRSTLGTIIANGAARPDSLVNHGLMAESHDVDTLLLHLYPNRTA